ncbi:MAG: 2-aminoethylphosphonate--pyruvate transaminase [Verrucomicrobiales bacterium]|nr:2-aminoethylphosphonate--pyruvate transaminase [Verrucomicrobiales bacterium]
MKRADVLVTDRDKTLFTPGPLTTSLSVKSAMLHDAGSWHFEFNARVSAIREALLALAGVSRESGWEAVLMQGSGTFGVEAVFLTCVPPQGKVVVLANGAYGERAATMLKHAKIDHVVLRTGEDTPPDPAALDQLLAQDPAITHVMAVHCETTSGVLNRIQPIGEVARKHRRVYIVDAMSSFGAIPIDFEACGIDYLISSANKCIEGVPGFSFVICRRQLLLGCEGWARSLSLDLVAQLKGFEKNGQFRYTPPTHSLLAFEQALVELHQEGGIAGRALRYQRNHAVLVEGMKRLGFRSYLPAEVQSYIITSFYFPSDPRFTFDRFYRSLSDKGYIIYPGKISQADLFRIGNIGRLFEADMRGLLGAVAETVRELELKVP